MRDEPRNHPLYLALLALTALGSVPFAFVGRTPGLALGLPVWRSCFSACFMAGARVR